MHSVKFTRNGADSGFDPFAPFEWRLAHGRSLTLGPTGVVMGIVNVTPDSFSDGGRLLDPRDAIEHALEMVAQGAAIVDVGGESTRPGAEPVSAQEEQARILPVIAGIAARSEALISVDTYRAQTADRAIAAGAHIVNDVWGLQRDPEIADVVSRLGAGAVIMHTGRGRERSRDVVADQIAFLERSLAIAEAAGLDRQSAVLDPGLGFAKDPDENFELLAQIGKLFALGQPLLVGASRKRFIGHATGREAVDRDAGTAATSTVARLQGAAIVRVHDVAANRDALAIADAVLAAGRRLAASGGAAGEKK